MARDQGNSHKDWSCDGRAPVFRRGGCGRATGQGKLQECNADRLAASRSVA